MTVHHVLCMVGHEAEFYFDITFLVHHRINSHWSQRVNFSDARNVDATRERNAPGSVHENFLGVSADFWNRDKFATPKILHSNDQPAVGWWKD